LISSIIISASSVDSTVDEDLNVVRSAVDVPTSPEYSNLSLPTVIITLHFPFCAAYNEQDRDRLFKRRQMWVQWTALPFSYLFFMRGGVDAI
jgi:hypothetical protein